MVEPPCPSFMICGSLAQGEAGGSACSQQRRQHGNKGCLWCCHRLLLLPEESVKLPIVAEFEEPTLLSAVS
jgi:hypothetical protein